MAVSLCEDCGELTNGDEFCGECEKTAEYVYSTGQLKAATAPVTDEPEAA